MKPSIKRNLLYLIISICFLVATGWIARFSISRLNSPRSDEVSYSGSASYPAWDPILYAQSANTIIIGKVKTVSDPYIPKDIIKIEQEAQIDIYEILKGDPGMTTLTVTDLVGLMDLPSDRNAISLKGIIGLLKPQEKVLLFLGKTPEGKYVPSAGPYGKYLIDESDNVTSIGDFKMSLKDLKSEIQEALKLPPKEHISIPIEEMY